MMLVYPGNVVKLRQWCIRQFFRIQTQTNENLISWYSNDLYISSNQYGLILNQTDFIVEGFPWSLIDVMLFDGRVVLISEDSVMEKIN